MIRRRKPLARGTKRMPRYAHLRSRSLKFGKPRAPWHPQIVRLRGQAKTELRREAYARSGGKCEGERNGVRCDRPISWYDFRWRFELAHVLDVGKGGSDVLENVLCLCQYGPDPCHREGQNSHHPGPQWSVKPGCRRCPKCGQWKGLQGAKSHERKCKGPIA